MAQQNAEPTLYQLEGHDLHLTYSTTTIAGQPQFGYQGALGTRTLSGNEIRTQQSELGTLVSVTLVPTVDATSVTLTVLIPSFNMGDQNEQSFKTLAIQARHAGPDTVQVGARESYEVFHVHGRAKVVMS
jgi:hypothetical protein